MHHDGIHYFPLPYGSKSSSSGLLVMNHEYTDDGLLHADGFAHWSAEKVRKSQNAHGCSVIEVRSRDGQWEVVRPSPFARRITAATPMRIAGPAAGHALMKTAADPSGARVLGTFNDCAHGYTPWGTYLACEENWDTYFVNSGTLTADQRRNGITAKGRGYRWDEFDERFDAGKHPQEPNRHGWVVEFDPYNPQSQPVKRTALGRFSHEGAWPAMAADGRLVMYMGDDRVFEYIYKFVSRDRVNPNDRAANASLLDHGTLYVATFGDDGRGEWLPLVHGQGALTVANGFADQADVLVRTRAAADAMGATKMDRPEWIAVHPHTKEVYCTLTNNSQRAAKDRAATDRANPRANNVFGHIIRWRETGNDPAATRFEWDLFAVAGDPQHPDAARRGNIRGDAYGSPDGLWFDDSGLLWIQTDVSSSTLGKGHYERLGNNMMLAADVRSGETRRFLTGPSGCEVTGVIMTPDARTMFVNIQHPGESPSERSDPKNPRAYSSWPDGGRPRSATVVIRRNDGGVIGS
jgi:secreted PhoX family phosphatase